LNGLLHLGSYDHVALELPDNPFALRPDAAVKSFGRKTG
jgi:hypothetical protein